MNKTVKMEDMLPLIEEQLNAGGSASFRIHGVSMMPMLRDRQDGVTVVKPSEAPKKYDIILYRRPDGNFVLHRIVGQGEDGFICRGDNQTVDEYPVKCDDVIAKVSEYTRSGKTRSIGCFLQRSYAFLWVNGVFLRRAFSKGKDK